MERIDEKLLTINKSICNNIDLLAPNHRGLLSQNILSQLRNLVEHISFKIFSNGRDLDVTYDNICGEIERSSARFSCVIFASRRSDFIVCPNVI